MNWLFWHLPDRLYFWWLDRKLAHTTFDPVNIGHPLVRDDETVWFLNHDQYEAMMALREGGRAEEADRDL